MEANRRNERITRYRHPGIIPLELWDLLVNGRILWETMQERDFHEILCRIVLALRRGEGETRSEGHVPEVISGFDSLYVAGGRSQEPAIRRALSGLQVPAFFSRTPEHPGEKRGLHLLASYGAGWLCDLGQTSLKICASSGRMQFRRDLERLPVRTDDLGESVQEQRRQLRGWLSESLRTFSSKETVPEAILFAMPSRLDDAGVPEGSSYIGMAGDASLIIDAINAAGVAPKHVLLVNDAELAALDALAASGLQGSAKTLVITLGFGLGAALAIRHTAEGNYHA